MLPVAVLCGGKGTRSGLPINKCFTDVNGKPFILHQLEWLESQGYTTVTLCRGDRGTLTALREAAPQLGERFLVLYGDTLTRRLPLNDFVGAWLTSGKLMATAVWYGNDDGGIAYRIRRGDLSQVDAGVSGVHVSALDVVGADVTDFGVLRDRLDWYGAVYPFFSPVGWVEVGTPEALENARRTLA